MRNSLAGAAFAILVSLLVLVPTVETISGGVSGLAEDLATGTFNPLGPPGAPGTDFGLGGGNLLGGFVGRSEGGYVPGETSVPERWSMDRSGLVGNVVIDYVFQPALGSMKRLKAFDAVGEAPRYELGVDDPTLRPVAPRPGVLHDQTFRGSFEVELHRDRPTPIFSPAPDAIVREYETTPPVPGGLRFLKDGADTFYVSADHEGRVRLDVTYRAPSAYFGVPAFAGGNVDSYPADVRPIVDAATRERVQLVLARAGLARSAPEDASGPRGSDDVSTVVRGLVAYFNGFGEGAIPGTNIYDDLYLALALGETGCCRHRAFAFAVTAQAVGIPTRVVVNEAHAFVEVMLPGGSWHQANLGGCGTYSVNNPSNLSPLNPRAPDPRTEEDDGPREVVPTTVSLTSVTDPLEKGSPGSVRGVVDVPPGARAAASVKVDVYLNRTGTDRGTLVATGLTGPGGTFEFGMSPGRVVSTGAYDVVARALETRREGVVFTQDWSSPLPVSVTSVTALEVSAPETEGLGAPLLVAGTLTDATRAPVVGADVELLVDGAREATGTTNASGVARFRLTFDETGPHAVVLRFAGTPFLEASEASRVLDVVPDAVVVDPAPVAVRGGAWRLDGTLLSEGEPLDGRRLTVTFDRLAVSVGDEPSEARTQSVRLSTDPDGRFGADLHVPPDVPVGEYPVTFTSDEPAVRKSVVLTVRQQPRLVVDAPGDAYADALEEWAARVTLRTDLGEVVAAAALAVAVTNSTGGEVWRETVTNASGVAVFALPPQIAEPGAYVVAFHYNGSHTAAATTTALDVAVRAGAPPPFGLHLLPLVAASAVAALAALAAYVVLTGRGRAVARHVSRLVVAAGFRDASRVTLEFPGMSRELPPVWTPGEPLLARVRATRVTRSGEAPHAEVDVFVALEGAPLAPPIERLRTDANGVASTRVVLPHGTSLVVRARYPGSLRVAGAEARLEVRAADYRRESERAWRAFVERARIAGAPVSDASTPREVEAVLASWAPTAKPDVLEDAVSLYEALEYTERPVTRREFSALVLALGSIEKRTGGGAAGRGGA